MKVTITGEVFNRYQGKRKDNQPFWCVELIDQYVKPNGEKGNSVVALWLSDDSSYQICTVGKNVTVTGNAVVKSLNDVVVRK